MSYVTLSWVKFEPKKLYANKKVDKEMERLRSTQHAVACSQPIQDNSEVLPVELSHSQADEPPTSSMNEYLLMAFFSFHVL